MRAQIHFTRRDFIRSAALALAGTTVMACAPNAPATSAPAAEPVAPAEATKAPATKEAQKVVWYVRASPTENPWQRDEVIPAFKQLHPEIDIELIMTPSTEAFTKLLAMDAAGTTPDVWANNFGAGFTAGLGLEMIRPLSDYIDVSSDVKMENFGPVVIDLFSRAGKVWAIPFMTCGSFVFYNKDLFDAAGVEYPSFDWDDKDWTWEKMVELAGKLTKDIDKGPEAQYGLRISNGWVWYLAQWLWGVAPYTPEDDKTGYPCKINLTSEEALAGYQACIDLVYKDKVAPPPAQIEVISAGGNPFFTGKLAMDLGGGWGFWSRRDFTDFRFGAAAIPWQVSNSGPVWPDANMVGRRSKVAESGWKLVEYISGGEGLRGYVQATNAQPANKLLWDEWYSIFQEKVPLEELKAGMEGALKYGKLVFSHTMPDSGEIGTVLTQNLDPMFLGTKDVRNAAIDAEAAVNKMLEKNCGKTLEDAANSIIGSL